MIDYPSGPMQKTSRHLELVEYLEGELGEFMAPDWIWEDVTPNDLWNMNRSLILSYAHDPSSAYNDKIWSEVQHAWGDKERVRIRAMNKAIFKFVHNFPSCHHKATDLRQYLDDAMWRNRHARYLWAAMTHLTPSTISAILNPSGGFAKLSDKIARKVVRPSRQSQDPPPLLQCEETPQSQSHSHPYWELEESPFLNISSLV